MPIGESGFEHVTKGIAALTARRALVVLRFLLNNPQEAVCLWPDYTTLRHLSIYSPSSETGEIFGLSVASQKYLHRIMSELAFERQMR